MRNLIVSVAAILVVAMAGGVYANDTVNLDIAVDIQDTCTTITNGAAQTLALNPMTPAPVVNGVVLSAAPSIYCTNQSTHVVTCTPSNGSLTIGNDGLTDPIPYAINGCASPITGQGFSTATSIPFGIDIAAADYQDAEAGLHEDTVVITVTY